MSEHERKYQREVAEHGPPSEWDQYGVDMKDLQRAERATWLHDVNQGYMAQRTKFKTALHDLVIKSRLHLAGQISRGQFIDEVVKARDVLNIGEPR